jgi:RNA-binding protein
MVGKHGVTTSLRRELQQAAFAHELVKIRIASECPLDRFEVARRLGLEPGIRIVQMIGRVLLVYKRHPQEPRYEGNGKNKARAEPGDEPRSTRAGARSSAARAATADRTAAPTRRPAPRRPPPRRSTPHHPTAPVAEKVAGGRRGSRPSARSGITKSRSPGRR